MAFKDREKKKAYQRLQRAQRTGEQRERERLRCARYRAANRERLREYDRSRHAVHEMKRNTLREPQSIAAWRAALRWRRLADAERDARLWEAVSDARDMQLRLLAEVWFPRSSAFHE